MFNITKLYASLSKLSAPNQAVKLAGELPISEIKPEVTLKITRFCNLKCSDCRSEGSTQRSQELTTADAIALIKDLAQFGVRRLHFVGGEPLLRGDLFELVAFASESGILSSVSTNGTLMSRANAEALKRSGVDSVVILLEGIGREVDRHRRVPGSYNAVLQAYRNCLAAGVVAGIRTPLNRGTYAEISDILDLVEREQIQRVVFTHPVGRKPAQGELSHPETRRALDQIFSRAEEFHRRGISVQILTNGNHADPIFCYLQFARRSPHQALCLLPLLPSLGAHVQGAGVGAAGIDSVGNVYPDEYWNTYKLGNVREIPFSQIWNTTQDPLLEGLRARLALLKGQCANCRWKSACGGNMRVRAEIFLGDPWAADPACYLTNSEIDKENAELFELMENDVQLAESAA